MKPRGLQRQLLPKGRPALRVTQPETRRPDPVVLRLIRLQNMRRRCKTNEKLPRSAPFARPAPPEIEDDRLPDRILVFLSTGIRTDNATGILLEKSQKFFSLARQTPSMLYH